MVGTFLMTSKLFVRRTCVRAFFVVLLLVTGIANASMISPAYATENSTSEVLRSGTSGDCTWTFARVSGEVIFTIAPTNGKDGTLDSHSWHEALHHKELTERVVVKEKVRAKKNSMYMFRDFARARSFDLSGLDVSQVSGMTGMFYGCSAVTLLNLNDWDVSQVASTNNMFAGCESLSTFVADDWNLLNVSDLSWMFYRCLRLTTVNLRNWNVSNVLSTNGMFYECSALTSLDLSMWKGFREVRTESMFAEASSLEEIALGTNFLISEDAAFDGAGFSIGTRWMQVNLSEGGTRKNPKGRVFESPRDLLAFHRDRTLRKTDIEMYVRVAPVELTVSFNKGAQDVTGKMVPMTYKPWLVASLRKNAYKRDGYMFDGWKDSDGNVYTDRNFFKNDRFVKAARDEKIVYKTLELVAQWKKQPESVG